VSPGLEPIEVVQPPLDAVAVRTQPSEEPGFEVQLPTFSGPLAVLLQLIESRQLDVLTVPLAELADAYVAHLAEHPVDPAQLAEFVAVAAQLILIKSRSMLPGEMLPVSQDGTDEPGEEELRRRLVEYRALRDVARPWRAWWRRSDQCSAGSMSLRRHVKDIEEPGREDQAPHQQGSETGRKQDNHAHTEIPRLVSRVD